MKLHNFLILLPLVMFSQSDYRAGLLPQITLMHTVNTNWLLVFSAETRQIVYQGLFKDGLQYEYENERTDITGIINYRFTPNFSGGMGYMHRFEGGRQIFRTLQQIAFNGNWSGLIYAHRLRTDQTFSENEAPEFRLRYRFGLEIPLNGARLDDKEFYIRTNNEHIASIQSTEFAYEIRLLGMLGYRFSKNLRIESGIDYRVNELNKPYQDHQFWWYTGTFINF